MAKKKIALITGANRGLGFEIARQLGNLGITVLMTARNQLTADLAASHLTKEGIESYGVILDVINQEDISALPDFIEKHFGHLDILVNNAGILLERSSPATFDIFQKTFEVNTFAPYLIATTLLPLLKRSSAGRIVNQSSILGSITRTSNQEEMDSSFLHPAYNASKTALNSLTVILARQLAHTRIKVNAVHPGWVKTDMGSTLAPMEIVDGAKTAVRLATLPDDGPTGGFFHMDEQLPW
ncbi:SDR family oxidoreductase [Candidatus Paracaedibacter symbiosus]|uniref:SDR family oxidoreductase n=1 Tax=Candidatus Paracaedibacter symbiosus TaxID=244582 RepID=UPI0005096D1F|nr:SDR family oxidoreductase [Candidatus Paracaedibacter symbiosus]